jgi:uncharacterized protein (TIGR02246 family)
MTTTAGPTDADRAAVVEVPERIVTAWAKHDADAFAAVFTEDGSMILPGLYRQGRDDIRSFMTEAFAGPYKGTQVTGRPLDMRFFGDTAVITTKGGVLGPGEKDVAPERSIRASWVVVKQGGQWLLAAYQNSPEHN